MLSLFTKAVSVNKFDWIVHIGSEDFLNMDIFVLPAFDHVSFVSHKNGLHFYFPENYKLQYSVFIQNSQ